MPDLRFGKMTKECARP